MQAVVLAAGEGQRLRPFTATKPKVMIKVANKPILEYVISALADAGVRDIVMVVGYKKSRVMDYFGDGGRWNVKIRYAIQEKQLGTAHALRQAEKFVGDDFVVVSGDNIIDAETVKNLKKWSIAYVISDNVSKYGVLRMEDEKVVEIVEKPEKAVSNLVNIGIYMFGREVFEFARKHADIPDMINEMIASGYDFKAVRGEKWLDIVYPWDILKVNEVAMDFEGKMVAGNVRKAVLSGNCVVGRESLVGDGSFVENSVIGERSILEQNVVVKGHSAIGDNSRIGAFSYIENSVIGDNVVIAPHSYVKDSVIDDGCVISPKFTALSEEAEIVVGDEVHRVKTGAFIGENCKIGANVVVEAGSLIGRNCKVASNRVVKGRIPDDSLVV